ncbi:SGNH hydrolase domain-containing protein [Streptomyces sp. NBC_01294]|nr:SGNH hydrolase domain-containing protein [Streptomyces sp. NBC_01294]
MAVLALCAARAVRRGRAVRCVVVLVAAPLTLASFGLALYWTRHSASLAYLGTPSRVWQFGVGALLALLPWHLMRGPRPLRLLCGWAGAAAIGWCVVAYDAATPYPGCAALVPTLAAAAVILAGIPGRGERNAPGAWEVGRLLAGRAPRAVGRLSYNLYLWHWPVLVLAEARLGALGWPAKTALTLAAVLPALATLRWVERPLRRSRTVSELPRRGLSVGVTAVVLPVVLALVVGTTTLNLLGPAAPVDPKGLPPGAASGPTLLARTPGTPLVDGPVVPTPAQARGDFPPDGACEVAPAETHSPDCLFGAVDSPDRIVLLGDSHAGQWFSPMLALAAGRGWALQEFVKQGCPLPELTVNSPQLGRAYRECDAWRANTLERLRQQPKPRLIVIASLNRYTADAALLAEGWEKTLRQLRALGVPIVYVEDTPVPGTDVPACVSGSPDSPADCAFGREDALPPDALARRIASGELPGVRSVGVNPVLCPATTDLPGRARPDPALPGRRPPDQRGGRRADQPAGAAAHGGRGAAPLRPQPLRCPVRAGGLSCCATTSTARRAARRPPRTAPRPRYVHPGCPAPQWGTGEIETMTDSTDNVRLDGNGALEIVPTRKEGAWSSGRIETRRSDFAPPPGGILRIEASIALPDVTGAKAAGYWPAFWTLGTPLRDGYTGWPGIGEIDVMESVNGRDTVFGSLHCGVLEGGPCQEPVGLTSGPQPCPGCRTAFHSYAVEVDLAPGAEEVRWYLDGRVYHRVAAARMDAGTWNRAVDHGLFLILNVAVGGKLPLADGATAGPATEPGHPMRIDHVTVSALKRGM